MINEVPVVSYTLHLENLEFSPHFWPIVIDKTTIMPEFDKKMSFSR